MTHDDAIERVAELLAELDDVLKVFEGSKWKASVVAWHDEPIKFKLDQHFAPQRKIWCVRCQAWLPRNLPAQLDACPGCGSDKGLRWKGEYDAPKSVSVSLGKLRNATGVHTDDWH